jgi:hypothetical protein
MADRSHITEDLAGQSEISWNKDLETMIASEGEKCSGLAWLYTEAEQYYSRMNTQIAIPVIVLSTVTGFVSGSSQIIFNNPSTASIGIGAVSLFTGILSTIGSYFAWAKKTEGCRISALQYRKLQKFITTEMTLPKVERIDAKDMLKMIRETVERLLETSPAVPKHIILLYNTLYKTTKSENIVVSHPEMTEGVIQVKINRNTYDDEVDPKIATTNVIENNTKPKVAVRLTL